VVRRQTNHFDARRHSPLAFVGYTVQRPWT